MKTIINKGLTEITSVDNNSTRDLAEIVGKRHSDVLRTIYHLEKKIANAGLRRLWTESKYIDGQGKNRKHYLLTKKGLLLLASKYSDELRLQIIERLEVLEIQNQKAEAESKRRLELELSYAWNKSDTSDLYR
ncbi:Rha family transcriptional regulator [Croceitalea rosinachiae]|uniref:Rha family transcriptional regulator n=1 Tax=Croceitalea rosinachiae TaxID=3075596 RepID=A0ABU3AGI9_9FLAO|nr:Rha family transcriptional regulator [Croceitalea sp. F388]MDT0608011.1 Rha family transcriptional regulator [Croceitalea sp. F388]